MKFYLFLLISLMTFTYSCQNQSQEEQLLDEALAIHDEVMPEMQTIYQLRKELSSKKDSLSALGENEKIQVIESRMEELSEANESMMQWMRNFNKDFEGNNNLSRKDYLEHEKEQIAVVKEDMESAIKNAKSTLKSI